MHLKISSAKWRPFRPGGDELILWLFHHKRLIVDNCHSDNLHRPSWLFHHKRLIDYNCHSDDLHRPSWWQTYIHFVIFMAYATLQTKNSGLEIGPTPFAIWNVLIDTPSETSPLIKEIVLSGYQPQRHLYLRRSLRRYPSIRRYPIEAKQRINVFKISPIIDSDEDRTPLWTVPCQCLNQWWLIVVWALGVKFNWNLNKQIHTKKWEMPSAKWPSFCLSLNDPL